MNTVTISIGKVAITFTYADDDAPVCNLTALMRIQQELNAEMIRVGNKLLPKTPPSSIAPG